MASNNRTYVSNIPDDFIRVMHRTPWAAILACKLPAFEDADGKISVSIKYLADLWGVQERTLSLAANKLKQLHIWYYKAGNGRGAYTEWKKGANFATFIGEERVRKTQEKGAKNATYNKIQKDNKRAGARERFYKSNYAGDTPATPRKGKRLSFEEYYRIYGDTAARPGWKLYKPEGYEKFIFEKL